jgi:hypothetical protein
MRTNTGSTAMSTLILTLNLTLTLRRCAPTQVRQFEIVGIERQQEGARNLIVYRDGNFSHPVLYYFRKCMYKNGC